MPRGPAYADRWCAMTVVVSVNMALLLSGIGVGIYISTSLQSNQNIIWEVCIFCMYKS